MYADRRLHPQLARAAQLGGAVSCISALHLFGVWAPPGHGLHVRLHSDAHVRSAKGVRRIHRRGSAPGSSPIDTPLRALEIALTCVDDLTAVILIDSAMHSGLVSRAELEPLLAGTNRGRRLGSRVDSRAESGTETIVRVRLRARGVRLRTQVPIAGIGRVDLLVGDRLVIEVDGETWHDRESTFESDRARDSALVTRGYIVLRYSYRRVMDDWDNVEREILSLVRRRVHVRRSGGNRQPRT
jgi:very-short-patch-repair endonuclease